MYNIHNIFIKIKNIVKGLNDTEIITIQKTIGKVVNFLLKRIKYEIKDILSNKKYNKAGIIFSKQINQTIQNNNEKNFSKEIDNIIYHLLSIIRKSDFKDENVQKEIFNQVLIYLNKSKFNNIFNTISRNKLNDFKDLTIGEKLYIILNNNYGICCRHATTILFNLFEELKELGLKISNIIFLEKMDRSNHTGFLVKFQGTIYLVDSSMFNGKLIQPLNDLKKDIEKYKVNEINREDPQNIGNVLQYEESKSDYILYFKDYNSFLNTYNKLPQEIGKVSIRPKKLENTGKRNLFDRLTGIKMHFFSNGILFQNGIFFEFGDNINKINEEDIKNPENTNLIDFFINGINGKIIISKKGNKKGKYTQKDKNILKRQLSYIIPKINKYELLNLIKNPNNKFET